MTTRIFGTYRPVGYTRNVPISGGVSINGWYTPSGKISNQFSDYEQAGLTKILDMEIPESSYNSEIVP